MHSETQLPCGVLALSIDLEPAASETGLARRPAVEATAARLIELFTHYRLPATWAVAEPGRSTLAAEIASLRGGHEIALLGDASWLGGEASRAAVAAELSRRVLAGRAAGLPISTLAPRGTVLDDHLDLAIQFELTAVRGVIDEAGRAAQPAQPNPLHFGLWEVPGTLTLPGEGGWLRGNRGWKARWQVDRAVREGLVVHFVIDALGLAARPAALQTLERLLRYAQRQQQAGCLEVCTLAGLTTLLSPARRASGSRLMLRTAG